MFEEEEEEDDDEEAELEEEAFQSNMLMLKSVAMYVPGKNNAVMNASVFIAVLSRPLDTAIRALRRLSVCAEML